MILFVGNFDTKSLTYARQINNDVINIFPNDILNISTMSVGYISICDHTLEDFLTVLETAKEIHYISSDLWEDVNTKIQTESWLRFFSHKKPVYNLNFNPQLTMLDLEDIRKTNTSQVWAAGCSFTAGVGIEKNQRWGQLVADFLNVPVSFLAHDGASNVWAADQILRSDIKKDDIVLWGLTGISRLSYFNNNSIEFLVNCKSSDGLISSRYLTMTSDHLLYTTMTSIEQVIRKSQCIGFKLVIIMFPFFTQDHEQLIFQYLSQYKFFMLGYEAGQVDASNYIDLGSDNGHPGPKHNQYVANKVIKTLDFLTH